MLSNFEIYKRVFDEDRPNVWETVEDDDNELELQKRTTDMSVLDYQIEYVKCFDPYPDFLSTATDLACREPPVDLTLEV